MSNTITLTLKALQALVAAYCIEDPFYAALRTEQGSVVYLTRDEYDAAMRRDCPWSGPGGCAAWYDDELSELLQEQYYAKRIALREAVNAYNATHKSKIKMPR